MECQTGIGISVCSTPQEVECICVGGYQRRYYPCLEGPVDPCCPDLKCVTSPYDGDGRIPLLEDCTIGGIDGGGAQPYTYKLENPGWVPFGCGLSNSPQYPIFRLQKYTDSTSMLSGATGAVGDPDLTKSPGTFGYMRYYKLPSEPGPISATYQVDFSRYCLKLHETPSQEAGVSNRVMIISGRNIYRYSGVLSGDPAVPTSDPFWDDPGGSGIKQIEESISGRSFPLPDYILQLPLWGETGGSGADNLGAVDTDNCTPGPYIACEQLCATNAANQDQCLVCVGDENSVGCPCVLNKPYAATGHYLPNDQGYTAGYYSFSCFNPYSYLDSLELDGTSITGWIPCGDKNAFGFGALGLSDYPLNFGCTSDGSGNPINCNGLSGATAHGPRLGVPTCSLYALIKALYARVFKAYQTNDGVIGLTARTERLTESEFRSGDWLQEFASAVDACLAADPSGTTNGTSNVQYHLAKISEQLLANSTQLYGDGYLGPMLFTFPNVFLWDRAKFTTASATDKWKHLYVIGNGNIVFDSSSAAITGPCYVAPTSNQDYRSFVFTLDEVTHKKDMTVTDRTEQARMFVFNGSAGPTIGGGPDDANPVSRKNAASRISLTELPVCFGITTDAAPDRLLSLCEVCNAWPNAVCLDADACSPVTELTGPERSNCTYPGGLWFNSNCMTASYEVPGSDATSTFNYSFERSTIPQPYSVYVDPEIMLGFAADPWRWGQTDTDDPGESLSQPYRERLAAVSKRYTYMQQNVGGDVVGGAVVNLANPNDAGLTAFKKFFDRLTVEEKRRVMIEIEIPWLPILTATAGEAIDPNWRNNNEVRWEFERQKNLGLPYVAGLTPGDAGATMGVFKEVAKRLWKDASQYAKDNGAENAILFSSSGVGYLHFGLVPWAGARSQPTTDGRSWWRADIFYPSLEERYNQAMTGGTRENLYYTAEACLSSDANVIQLYNFLPNMGGLTTANAWQSLMERLVSSGGGSAAASSDFNLDDLDYWARMTFASSVYEYKTRLSQLENAGFDVDTSKPLAAIISTSSHPVNTGGLDGGYLFNNKWTYMKDSAKFAEIDIGGLFATADANVPNVAYPDQVWVWDATHEYHIRYPFGTWNSNAGTGSNTDEFMILTARSQLEKLLFKRPEMQTVAEGGLSSEYELVAGPPSLPLNGSDSALAERRRAWLRANSMPNVYWDARTFIDTDGDGIYDTGETWYSEGVTNNVRYWSALTGNCLPAPCVLDRSTPLARWLDFNKDLYKNDVRVAIKHWISERQVSAIEESYKVLNRIDIPPIT